MRRLLIGMIISALLPAVAWAQTASDWVQPGHTRVRLVAPQAVAAGVPFFAAVEVQMEDDWHTYWQNPGEAGIPTRVVVKAPEGAQVAALHYPVPHRFDTDGIINYGYSETATFLVPVTLATTTAGDRVALSASIDMLVCKEMCVPGRADLAIDVPLIADKDAAQAAAEADPFASWQEALPKLLRSDQGRFNITDGKATFTLPLAALPEDARAAEGWDFAVLTQGTTSINAPEVSVKDDALQLVLKQGTVAAGDVIEGVLLHGEAPHAHGWQVAFYASDTAAATAQKKSANVGEATAKASANDAAIAGDEISLWLAVLLALLGGAILNLMPCVFPVLSLKALAIARKAESDIREVRRHGLAYTFGVVLCFAALGLGMLALRAAGSEIGWGFQLQQPAFVASMSCLFLVLGLNLSGVFEWPLLATHIRTDRAGTHPLLGSVATGLLAALVATPCTAPFMGTALGASLTMPATHALAIFVALGVGMAAPFLLLSLFPKLVRFLPKPGAWMQRLKEVLAFPMYAACAWLLWVAAQQLDSVGHAWVLVALTLTAIAVWGWRLVHHRAALWRYGWLLLMALLIASSIRDAVQVGGAASAAQTSESSVAFSPEALAELRAQGTPVLVDATAAWCLTCKLNERNALADATVKAAFAERGVTLMVADWTKQDARITEWLASFGRNGVPLYVYYPPNGEPRVLPQLLTPGIVLEALGQE